MARVSVTTPQVNVPPFLLIAPETFEMICERLYSIQELIFLSQTCRKFRKWSREVKTRLPAHFQSSWAGRVLAPHPQLLFSHYVVRFSKLYCDTTSTVCDRTSLLTLVSNEVVDVSEEDLDWLTNGAVFRRGLPAVVHFCAEVFQGMTIADVEHLRDRRDLLIRAIKKEVSYRPQCYRCPKSALHDYPATMINYINLCCLHRTLPWRGYSDPHEHNAFRRWYEKYHLLCNLYLRDCMVPELRVDIACSNSENDDRDILALRDLLMLLQYYMVQPPRPPTLWYYATAISSTGLGSMRKMSVEAFNFLLGYYRRTGAAEELMDRYPLDLITGRRSRPCPNPLHAAGVDMRCEECDHLLPGLARHYEIHREFYAVLGVWLRSEEVRMGLGEVIVCFTSIYDHSQDRDFSNYTQFSIPGGLALHLHILCGSSGASVPDDASRGSSEQQFLADQHATLALGEETDTSLEQLAAIEQQMDAGE